MASLPTIFLCAIRGDLKGRAQIAFGTCDATLLDDGAEKTVAACFPWRPMMQPVEVAGQEAREGLLEIRLAVQNLPDLGNHITQKALASGFLNFTRKKTLGRV